MLASVIVRGYWRTQLHLAAMLRQQKRPATETETGKGKPPSKDRDPPENMTWHPLQQMPDDEWTTDCAHMAVHMYCKLSGAKLPLRGNQQSCVARKLETRMRRVSNCSAPLYPFRKHGETVLAMNLYAGGDKFVGLMEHLWPLVYEPGARRREHMNPLWQLKRRFEMHGPFNENIEPHRR